MSILLEHSDLVGAVAADHDVSFSLLQGLLSRERDFALATADGRSIDMLAAASETPEASPDAGSPILLRVASLATDNLTSLEPRSSDPFADSPAAAIHRGYWSPSRILRLLLLGTADAGVRTVGFPPLQLQRHEFIVGRRGVWPGLLRSPPMSESPCPRIVCGFDGAGGRIEVERVWHTEGTNWREELHIRKDGRSLTGCEANEWLYQVAPPEAVPFFVFDASDVAASMQSSSWRERAIDRLYPSAFVAALESALLEQAEPQSGHTDCRSATRRVEAGTAQARRHWHRAVRMRNDVRCEIDARLQVLADAEGARRRLGNLMGVPASSASDRGYRLPSITVPNPLGEVNGHVAAPCAARNFRSRRTDIVRRHLAERLADLDIEIDDLQAAIETARRDERRWTELAEACDWWHHAVDAEPALAAAIAPMDTDSSGRLASCLADLGDRIRRRMCERLRLAFHGRVASLDLPPRCTYGLAFDDLGSFTLWCEPGLAKGPQAFVDERAAFVLMQAFRDASGRAMPTFAVLDPAEFDERNLEWLRLRHLPSIAGGGIVLMDPAVPGAREVKVHGWFSVPAMGDDA